MGKIVSINPTTEEIYGELEENSDIEIIEKVKMAREERNWSRSRIENRVEIVKGLVELLEESKEKIARVMAFEIGKPLKAGRHEIEIAKKRILDFCKIIPDFIKDNVLFDNNVEKNIVVFEPVGVVVVISPWNAPVFVSLAMIIPPLLCGNNVIWKPSEYSSFTALEIHGLFEELRRIGFNKNAFQIVIGGKEVGRKLVESNVNMVALTGSVRAGREVGKMCGERLKKFILELGGKDPAIVLEDADINRTAHEIVKSSTMYTGQVCFGVERVYCHFSIYDKFVEKCVEETLKLKVGNPLDDSVDIGPFSVKFQFDKVIEHIDDALSKGAKLVCGGQRLGERGYFLTPGVMVNVNYTMKIMKDETFGPITPIVRFDNVNEAIKLVNDSDYGLTASIWTNDLVVGEEIARQIEAGTVEINRHGMSKAGCPWGGYKNSGSGRIYSREGVREFCNVKHVWIVK